MSEPNHRSCVFAFGHEVTKMEVFESINGYPRELFAEVAVLRGGRAVKVFVPLDPNFRAYVSVGELRKGCLASP